MNDGLHVLSNAGIKENIEWFMKIQGLVSLNIDYDRVVDIAAKKIAKISDEVREKMETGGTFGHAMQMLKTAMLPSKDKEYVVGEKRDIYVYSAKYQGGTRLRDDPAKPGEFNGKIVINGNKVKILDVKTVEDTKNKIKVPYAMIQAVDRQHGSNKVEGWILQRNLTFVKGRPGTLGQFQDGMPKLPKTTGKRARVSGNSREVSPADATEGAPAVPETPRHHE